MFWRIPNLSASSPVDTILDKESFTLEELLDEEEIIQECKALNTRLINFLRDRVHVEQLLRYIVEDAAEDAESKRTFKFPFIACEIFTCEIDVILKTLVEDEELMTLLFSFLEPSRPHSSLLAGYFSKVVLCLMLRKTTPLMNYVQVHDNIFQQLVDLIGITSIMEVLVRLVGADDHMYPNFVDVMQWLADSHLLEMIVDKLNPSCPPEVHANAAAVLWAITRNAPSALAAKLSSPSFVSRILGNALEDPQSKSTLVHSLSVCICLLDPKKTASTALVHSVRNQHLYEPHIPVDPETVNAMLPKLDDVLSLLNVSSDECALPATYGELRPPLGKHRLKIVEFIATLLGTGSEASKSKLVKLGAIQRIIDLFFEYPFNNALHHHVESIIMSCLESNDTSIIDHVLCDCDIVKKILQVEKFPVLSADSGPVNCPTLPCPGRHLPRAGNLGHTTRIANKLVQLGSGNECIRAHLQENVEWMDWQTNVLHERNDVENVYRWACGRPSALQERTRDSDDDELHDRDYDVAALANNLSQAFRYNIYENEDVDEVHGSLDRDDEDVYFDDESAEVVISSLRLGDDRESSYLFTNSNWFAFQERISDGPLSTTTIDGMDDINLNETVNAENDCSDDEVVVGEDEFVSTGTSLGGTSGSDSNLPNEGTESVSVSEDTKESEKATASVDLGIFQFEVPPNNDLFNDAELPAWVGWHEPSDIQVDGPSDDISTVTNAVEPEGTPPPNAKGTDGCPEDMLEFGEAPTKVGGTTPLFEEDMEFVGVDLEGVGRMMERAIEGGLGGDAALLKMNSTSSSSRAPGVEIPGKDGSRLMEFNDMKCWRVEQEVGVVKE